MRTQIACFLVVSTAPLFDGAFAHGAYHELLSSIDREIEKNPLDPGLYVRRAKLHISHEQWVDAIADLERVDRMKPDAHLTDGIRGQALNLGREWGAAEEALNTHLRVHPGDLDARYERGKARFHLGNASGASEDFRVALGAARVRPAERVLLAVTAIQASEGVPSAARFLDDEIRDHGAEPALLERALSLALNGAQVESALGYLDLLKSSAPRPEPWMARRAEILELAGRRQDARVAWTALRDHLLTLSNLDRGSSQNQGLLTRSRAALGEREPAPVAIPPASHSLQIVSSPNP